jgi:nitrogen fixation/metabolism regulation signal transduction histidine kinase
MLRYLLVVGGAIVGILLFLLASGSENSQAFDQHYPLLLGLNALVAAALLCLVVLLLTRLYKRYKRGKFGSRLMARLVLLFAVIGVLPGTVIYLVSVQFVSRSIESWFDVRVESALESGLNLSRSALDASLSDLNAKAHNIAAELADLSDASQITQLSRLREQNQMQEATVVTSSGRIIASVGGRVGVLVPDLPTAAMLRQARMSRGFSAIEGGVDLHDRNAASEASDPPAALPAALQPPKSPVPDAANSLRLRVVVAIQPSTNGLSLQSESRFLQLLQPVPPQLAVNAEALREAYSEYQERSLGRTGLRKIYIVTLTLTLLLAIFGAIASAFLIASALAKPLLLLAEGTKAVAEGNFSPRPIVTSSDELGTLTQSFNTMTRQLFEARSAVEKNRTELENAKAYLESVLANMSAGVMVFDDQFKLVTCNESVERILQHDFHQHIGKPLTAVDGLVPLAQAITKAFSEQNAQSAGGDPGHLHWQQQIEIPRNLGGTADGDSNITLLARGSHLPVASGNGYVVVFDDISDVISAQRSIAWGEVARRLAHEIKNPLTPIQLSAERLQMKLGGKLAAQDVAMLNKGTETIVNQVTAMKRMVDDFRDYAKTPPAVLSALDLNALIEEILHLYNTGDERDIIHATLVPNLSHIMGDATQLRQVIHNLLQNAQDAVAERPDGSPPRIDVATEEIRYRNAGGAVSTAVRLSIVDNGPGFSPKILTRAFEPYVTSKARGTGLGLAMVKKIIEEHGGRIDIQNRIEENGAKIAILLLKLAPIDP